MALSIAAAGGAAGSLMARRMCRTGRMSLSLESGPQFAGDACSCERRRDRLHEGNDGIGAAVEPFDAYTLVATADCKGAQDRRCPVRCCRDRQAKSRERRNPQSGLDESTA